MITKGEPNETPGTWAWKFNYGRTEPARLFVSCRRCGRQQCSVDEKSIGDCVCGEPLSKATLKDFEAAPKPKKA